MGVVPDLAAIVRGRDRAQWRARRAMAIDHDVAGGRATAAALGGLDPRSWHVLHQVVWPGRPRTRIDHVVIGPPGVLVVDSKNWPGSITASAGVLRQDGARRERDLRSAAEAASAVRSVLDPRGRLTVSGVLCFTPPAMVTGWIDDVLLCATGDAVAVLGSLLARLDPEEVDELHELAVERLAPVSTSRRGRSGHPGPVAVPRGPDAGLAQAGS